MVNKPSVESVMMSPLSFLMLVISISLFTGQSGYRVVNLIDLKQKQLWNHWVFSIFLFHRFLL